MHPKIGRSSTAEEELKLLSERPALQSAVSTMDLNVLKERFLCSDIFPKVSIDLVRQQDQKKKERIDLAHSVAQTMATELSKTFTGNKDNSKLVLRVNITVVSDGCCPRNAKIANMLGRGTNQGKGLVKLTMSYCLFNRTTGKVAVAKQYNRCQERSCSRQQAHDVIMELEEELRHEMSKEITFSCCSRLPTWNQVSQRMIVVDPPDVIVEENANDEDARTECSCTHSLH